MTTANAREFAERFFKGQDRLKGELVPELVAPEYQADIAGFPSMDAAGHGGFGQAFYAGFPNIFHTIDEAWPSQQGIAVHFTLRGTHTGPFMGIPATGKAIEVTAVVLLTIANGKVTHLRGIFNQFGLLRQLGAVPG
jgi:predicted ester cyclase